MRDASAVEEEAGVAEAEVVAVAEVVTGGEAEEEDGVALETEIVEVLGTGGGTGMETGEGIVRMTEAGIEEGTGGSNQRGDQGADPQWMVPEGEMSQGGTAGIQEISDPTATPWIIRMQGGRMSQEQGGHRRQGAEARWEEGVRMEEGGMRGEREGWMREGRAVEVTVGENLDMDQDMSVTGDSRKGMEGSGPRPPQEMVSRGVMVEGTEERYPLLELMGESRPQEVMQSKDVLGDHQRQVHLQLLRRQ